ncbi:hypothetical protein DFQ28_005377 [Apophysomyces sp. BC1034]|nr:hypothetical protein DFQ28_005377 [Apophysomyces sp. BC1034]
MSVFAFQQENMDKWRQLSETDNFRLFLSPIMEIIFERSKVMLRGGETENSASSEVQKLRKQYSNDVRGAFKVDLRLILMHNGTVYDVGNCEFAKDGDLRRKNITDNIKVIVEAKCIADSIVKKCHMHHEEAKKLVVVNMQVCGKQT